MTSSSRGYTSSPDKNIVRDRFDLPLLRTFRDNKGENLKYFGMPGADCRDILSWRGVLQEIVAVERSWDNLSLMEKLLEKHFIEIRSSVHFGDVDKVILNGHGETRRHGGQSSRSPVANGYDQELDRWFWEFDIVYLDYFGPLLPRENNKFPEARGRRPLALRHLFGQERLDARGSWLLLLTVEGGKYKLDDLDVLERYINSARLPSSSSETSNVLDHLLADDVVPERRVTRLLHAAMALIVSSSAGSANLLPRPNATVSYSGFNGQSMVHSAFLLDKLDEPFGNYVDPLPLLRAPILRPITEGSSHFTWDQEPPPGTTKEFVRTCLCFLDNGSLNSLLFRLSE